MSDQEESRQGQMGRDNNPSGSGTNSSRPSSEKYYVVMSGCENTHVGNNTSVLSVHEHRHYHLSKRGAKPKKQKGRNRPYQAHVLRSAIRSTVTSASPVVRSGAVQQSSPQTGRPRMGGPSETPSRPRMGGASTTPSGPHLGGASTTPSGTSSPFSGKTLRNVFGPFLNVKNLGSYKSHVRHEVKLFGKVLSTFCPEKPNKMDTEKKRKLGVRCRYEKHLKIEFEMEAADGEKIVFPLIAFYDAVPQFRTIFKPGHFACERPANLDSLVDDEITVDGWGTGRIPVIMLPNFKQWSSRHYIEGTIKKTWKKDRQNYVVTVGDQTGTVNIVAKGIKAQDFSRAGLIKVGKRYQIRKGSGNIVAADAYISASCPVQLNVGQNTTICPLTNTP